jgi:hypothetical protein
MNTATKKLFEHLDPETKRLLEGRPVTAKLCRQLNRIKPERQVEIVRLMVASGILTAECVRVLVLATDRALLAAPKARPRLKTNRKTQLLKSNEITALAKRFSELRGVGPSDFVVLFVYCQYAQQLLENNAARKYLVRRWPDVCSALQTTLRQYRESEFIQFDSVRRTPSPLPYAAIGR